MSEPFQGTASELAARRAAEQRQLVKAYKGTFQGSSHGRLVWANLKKMFRFDECEADSELHSDNIIARRCFAKKPLYHIKKMLDATLREVAKPKRALAGNHHEQKENTPSPG